MCSDVYFEEALPESILYITLVEKSAAVLVHPFYHARSIEHIDMFIGAEMSITLFFQYMPVIHFRSLWKAYEQVLERDLEQVVYIFKVLQYISKKDNIPFSTVKLFLCNGFSAEVIITGISENLFSFFYEASIAAADITDLPRGELVYIFIKNCKKIAQPKPGHLRSGFLQLLVMLIIFYGNRICLPPETVFILDKIHVHLHKFKNSFTVLSLSKGLLQSSCQKTPSVCILGTQ